MKTGQEMLEEAFRPPSDVLTREQIENRRKFLRGITKPDDWVDALCNMALRSLDAHLGDNK